VRDGDAEPELLEASNAEALAVALDAARRYVSRGDFVGIICPDTQLAAMQAALRAEGIAYRKPASSAQTPYTVLSPTEAKGLEFDSTVVVFPEQIAEGTSAGLRLLYIAYTRSTRSLAVVHQGDPLAQNLETQLEPIEEQQGRRRSSWWSRSGRSAATSSDYAAAADSDSGTVNDAGPTEREQAATASAKWTELELRTACEAYCQVLSAELVDQPVDKPGFLEELANGALRPRTVGSVGYRMMNISAVVAAHDHQWVDEWKPQKVSSSVAAKIWEVIEPMLADLGTQVELTAEAEPSAIAKGVSSGQSIDEVAKGIRDTLSDWSVLPNYQIRLLARLISEIADEN
jgi:hypothetical protein